MVDVVGEGLRPREDLKHPEQCDCLRACPVLEADYTRCYVADDPFQKQWGPVLELWEGHAVDPEIRFRGASGGVLTALAAYCLERLEVGGVLHIGQDPDDPTHNRTFLSRTRDELLQRTGSRYAPAAVCERLDLVEHSDRPCVIIGRPVEIAAIEKLRRLRPALEAKISLTLSFFCAESPSRLGTLKLLQRAGINPEMVTEIRYRGDGWPGAFTVRTRSANNPVLRLSYRETWAFLQAYRPWAAHLWPDGTGELADISCGDPWYEEPDGKNPGFSLVVVRTERGRKILHGAMRAGYLALRVAEPWKLERSQAGLLAKKGSVWGRRLALKLCGLPAPCFRGLDLWHCWRRLPWREKLKSVLGTLRRVWARKLYRPLELSAGVGAAQQAIEVYARDGTRPDADKVCGQGDGKVRV